MVRFPCSHYDLQQMCLRNRETETETETGERAKGGQSQRYQCQLSRQFQSSLLLFAVFPAFHPGALCSEANCVYFFGGRAQGPRLPCSRCGQRGFLSHFPEDRGGIFLMPLYVSLLYVCAERTGVRDPPVGLAIAPPTLSPSHLPPAKELSPPCSAHSTLHTVHSTLHTEHST